MIQKVLFLVSLVTALALPHAVYAAPYSCDDYVDCGTGVGACDNAKVYEGVFNGSVDMIGNLVCFINALAPSAQTKAQCTCFTAITDMSFTSPAASAWSVEVANMIDACGGTATGDRSLSGIAFDAANTICSTAEFVDIPTFTEDIRPILSQYCDSCHSSSASGGFQYAAGAAGLADLVNVPSSGSPLPYVAPGNPAGSYLLAKIQGSQLAVGGAGNQMPNAAGIRLDYELTIEEWIRQGAH